MLGSIPLFVCQEYCPYLASLASATVIGLAEPRDGEVENFENIRRWQPMIISGKKKDNPIMAEFVEVYGCSGWYKPNFSYKVYCI
jgi:hypothetical protein